MPTPKKSAAAKPEVVDLDTPEGRAEAWRRLAEPFDQSEIERLPKPVRRDDRDKGKCEDSPRGRQYSADGHFCGGWHARSVHLSYVGHAGITTRLNEVVGPEGWTLEPFALDPDGMPIMGRGQNGEFWVKLTILGVTKWEVAAHYNSTQEAVGDALRRAAMRFGVGTYLWSKSDAAAEKAAYSEPDPEPAPAPEQARQQGRQQRAAAEPEAAVVTAQYLAAQKADTLEALREVWDQAGEAGTLAAMVADENGSEQTLSSYITARKAALEGQAAAAEAAETPAA